MSSMLEEHLVGLGHLTDLLLESETLQQGGGGSIVLRKARSGWSRVERRGGT